MKAKPETKKEATKPIRVRESIHQLVRIAAATANKKTGSFAEEILLAACAPFKPQSKASK